MDQSTRNAHSDTTSDSFPPRFLRTTESSCLTTTSLVACSYLSLVFYTLAPSAPQWYNGVASNLLAATSAQIGSSGVFLELARIGSFIESDKLAAFLSLHAAYVVLFSYFTIKLKRTYGLVSIPIIVGVLFSTIYLGQHYTTDLVAGVAVAATCVLIVTRLDKKRKITSLEHSDWKALKPTGPESAT